MTQRNLGRGGDVMAFLAAYLHAPAGAKLAVGVGRHRLDPSLPLVGLVVELDGEPIAGIGLKREHALELAAVVEDVVAAMWAVAPTDRDCLTVMAASLREHALRLPRGRLH
jgi:hypothetical protein